MAEAERKCISMNNSNINLSNQMAEAERKCISMNNSNINLSNQMAEAERKCISMNNSNINLSNQMAEAERKCEDWKPGGHVVTISNKNESDAVFYFMSENGWYFNLLKTLFSTLIH